VSSAALADLHPHAGVALRGEGHARLPPQQEEEERGGMREAPRGRRGADGLLRGDGVPHRAGGEAEEAEEAPPALLPRGALVRGAAAATQEVSVQPDAAEDVPRGGGGGRSRTGAVERPLASPLRAPKGLPVRQGVPQGRGPFGAVGLGPQPTSVLLPGPGLPVQRQVRASLAGRADVEDEGERLRLGEDQSNR